MELEHNMAISPTPSPKDRFTALDTLAVVRELRALGRWRVDKVYDRIGGGWIFSLRVAAEGRHELVLVPGRYAALVAQSLPHSDELSAIARDLRRILSGAVVAEIGEPGGERFLEIQFQRADLTAPLTLALELFGSGNLIVARGEKIVAVARPKTWAHRAVRVGAEYQRPPNRLNPWVATARDLQTEFLRSRSDLTHTLAARLALGGPLAEEILARTGLNGAAPATQSADAVATEIHRAIQGLLSEVGEHPKGYLYEGGGSIFDVEPFHSVRWAAVDGANERITSTFGEAAQAFFDSLVTEVRATPSRQAEAHSGWERQRAQQVAAIDGLKHEAALLQAQAETLFAKYQEAEEALARAKQSEDELGRRVTITLANLEIPVFSDRSIRESAQALYEEGKKAQSKLAGALAALSQTDLRLKEVSEELAKSVSAPEARPEVARRGKPHWFEKYRWFISSDGAVVVAGRDASSNDLVVRRYLHDGDLYVHADIHGAASVVVKHPTPGEPSLTDATLREAGQWAVAFSKAWRAGLASASAFWVTNDQVSKAGASGEFVAKGAWVIHGTKHAMVDLPLELAIGQVQYKGEALWAVAPPTAVRARGKVEFLLTPGLDRERDDREIALARDLGIPRSRLQALLPAGGLEVRRP
jgi:predicted ribosome quality control (RQC) complex YloA/Tae2 family protein